MPTPPNRGVGLPASRTGYAFVRLNGQPYGLYLNIEDMDDVALERWFGKFEDPQHLYEGESGADVKPGAEALPPDEGGFEVDEGDEANLADLKALIAAVNSTEGEGWSAAVGPVADLTEMTRIWAVEKYIGHWDGYAGQAGQFQPNNYFLYSDPAGVFQMLPWGADETFERHLAFDGSAGLMFDKCLADLACLALYRQELAAVGKAIAALDLGSLANQTAAVIRPWEEADPRLEHPDLVEDAVTETTDFIAERQGELAAWLGPEDEEEDEGPVASAPSPPGPGQAEDKGEPAGSAPGLHIERMGALPHAILTHLDLAAAGSIQQVARFRTSAGSLEACSTQASASEAKSITLHCQLDERVRRRLQRRWLRLEVSTTFTPSQGDPESVTRHVLFRRATRPD